MQHKVVLKQLPETTDKFWGELWTTDKEFWLDEESDVEQFVCFDPPKTETKNTISNNNRWKGIKWSKLKVMKLQF